LIELAVTGGPDAVVEYWGALGITVLGWAIALLASVVVGIALGLTIGRNQRAQDSTHFLIDFLRTIPSLAIVPLLLLLLGTGIGMVAVTAFLTAVWPVLIQSIYAGRLADPSLHQVARSFRLTRWDRVRYVLTPDAIAFIWPGLRLAVTASLLSTVAAQLIGSAPGIGQQILKAQLADRTDSLFAWVLTAAALGLLINALLMWAQRRVLWWHPSMRDQTS
jgi:ABC-type nitrate/sulfonate/bicarbonate transport system permease component